MILIDNVHKSFGQKQVLRGISMKIDDGETTVIIGRSGTGKSVLLKLIVGLLEPDEGTITIDGRRVDQMSEADLYEMRRRIGYVFQGAALFDSMTVAENLVLGLYEHGERDQARLEREVVTNLINVGLLPDPKSVAPAEFQKAYQIIAFKKPAELSGGMRKRVGVARALVGTPKYIFYDEPTTGLDPITSEQIDNLVCDLTHKLDVTSIVITHDIFSVYKVAHKVVMLENGLIHFTGSPSELQRSKDPVVQDFWVKEFANYGDRYTQEATPAIQNKIGQFTGNPLIRNIIGQPKSSFDIRELMDQKKILIINLSKGLVGDTNMRLLGSMLVTRIFLAAMSRAELSPTELKKAEQFYLYVDEFQNFANDTFSEMRSAEPRRRSPTSERTRRRSRAADSAAAMSAAPGLSAGSASRGSMIGHFSSLSAARGSPDPKVDSVPVQSMRLNQSPEL